jgi:toxin-antitoxin system PIN domain toxin
MHHAPALSWLQSVKDEPIGFCRLTQLSFLRLLTHPAVMKDQVLSPPLAWKLYDRTMEDDRIVFFEEPESTQFLQKFRTLSGAPRFSHGQWPDAYLAAFANVAGLVLVTFDRGLKELAGHDALLLS